MDNKGLTYLFTGDGKGKSSACFGIVLRSFGHNRKILVVQFIKGGWTTGEEMALEKMGIEFYSLGKGFIKPGISELTLEEHAQAAQEALEFTRRKIADQNYDLLIMDEINVAVHLKLISKQEVHQFLDQCPENLDIVLSGRYAPVSFIERSDLVTEMTEIKHPFKKGIPAKKGLDF